MSSNCELLSHHARILCGGWLQGGPWKTTELSKSRGGCLREDGCLPETIRYMSFDDVHTTFFLRLSWSHWLWNSLSIDINDFNATGCNRSVSLSVPGSSEVAVAFQTDDRVEGTEVLVLQLNVTSPTLEEVNDTGNVFFQNTSTITVIDTTGNKVQWYSKTSCWIQVATTT